MYRVNLHSNETNRQRSCSDGILINSGVLRLLFFALLPFDMLGCRLFSLKMKSDVAVFRLSERLIIASFEITQLECFVSSLSFVETTFDFISSSA